MALRSDIKAARAALVKIGHQIADKGAKSAEISAYASLLNSYVQMCKALRKKPKVSEDDEESQFPMQRSMKH